MVEFTIMTRKIIEDEKEAIRTIISTIRDTPDTEITFYGNTVYMSGISVKKPCFKLYVRSCCHGYYKPLRHKINGKISSKISFKSIRELKEWIDLSKSNCDNNKVIFKFKNMSIDFGNAKLSLDNGKLTLIDSISKNEYYASLFLEIYNNLEVKNKME